MTGEGHGMINLTDGTFQGSLSSKSNKEVLCPTAMRAALGMCMLKIGEVVTAIQTGQSGGHIILSLKYFECKCKIQVLLRIVASRYIITIHIEDMHCWPLPSSMVTRLVT